MQNSRRVVASQRVVAVCCSMQRLFRITLPLALVLCVACGAKTKPAEQHADEPKIEELVAELSVGVTSEVLVDFGSVEPRSVVSRDIRIVNTTDEPIVLLDYDTTCRCTTLEFERKPIAAGEQTIAVLTFDSRGEWGNVGNFLSVTTSNEECAMVVWMSAYVE